MRWCRETPEDSLEAHNELLFGHLEPEVGALQQRKAEYDEERRLSEGSDSCWSGADSDTDSAAELEVGREPPEVEGAAVVAAQGGELEGVAQGPLQPDGRAPAVLGRREQGEVGPLHPRGLAPKRLRDETIEQDGRGKQQQRSKCRVVASGACQGSEWILVVQSWLMAGIQ